MRASDIRLRVGAAMAAALALAACGSSGGSSTKPTGALAACGSGAKTATAPATASSESWPYSNDDLANTRDATGSTISSANVSRLAQAWTFKLTGKAAVGVRPYGSLTANPIVQNGVVYLQDLDSNVYALALATGRLEWEYRCNQPEKSGPGPNGVAVAGGDVYGLTPDGGVCAERRHRPDGLGQQRSPQRRPGHVRHPAAGRQTAGSISPASTARGPAAGCCSR